MSHDPHTALGEIALNGANLTSEQVADLVRRALPRERYQGRRVLLIIPDLTRTAPVGQLFRAIYDAIGEVTSALDVLVALGTHQPMSDEAICTRLDMTLEDWRRDYSFVRFFNHEWDNPNALETLGILPASDISELSEGRFAMDVPVSINRRVLDYDELLILGPVFPHEVVGFSGGNKYLFPGVSGPEILNFFHWLGAVITTVGVIGHQWTPVRRVVDRAASLVPVTRRCFAMVVRDGGLAALFHGTPEAAWDQAVAVSRENHILWKDRMYHTILSCAPLMYDELWVGAKCMYKLEPVLAEGGELIIYAPHMKEISVTHGEHISAVGYHCRDYFLKQWDRFKDYPWGVLAHSTHVFGQGTFEDGVEKGRARVTLATGIPEAICRSVNLGYRDPNSIRIEDYMDRESEGILYVPKAGETLYRPQSERLPTPSNGA